jgi:YVTN family beta-propeller protein
MKRLYSFIALLLVTCVMTFSQTRPNSASGTWRVESTPPGMTWKAVLRADGAKLNGAVSSCSSADGAFEIFDGKVDGNTITFNCRSGDGQRMLALTGKISGDEISFGWNLQVQPGGNPRSADLIFGASAPPRFTAKRVAETADAVTAMADALRPWRVVPDPGVIATNQRVTPAGVQSVFNGRVGGVKFGSEPGEVWVTTANGAWKLAWNDNRVFARAEYDGNAGVQGVAFDPVTRHVIVSSVGRLPSDVAASRIPGGPPLNRAKAVAQLTSFNSDGKLAANSGALGVFMAGAPAVATAANASGHRVIALPLPADDQLAILDADTGKRLSTVQTGVLPIAAAIARDGSTAWVTVLGGPKPKSGERAAKQCCEPNAEPVRVDKRGIAERGSVVRVDLVGGRITHALTVGLHPIGIAWDEVRGRLYVANGNSDAVSVIDTRRNEMIETITVAPFNTRKTGLAPTAVAVSPDGATLYVALGGVNAVAMYQMSAAAQPTTAKLRGLIPTGWYPNALDVTADGKTIAVGALLGVGSGEGVSNGQRDRFVHANRGSVNIIPVPTDAELTAYTTSVSQNNRLPLAGNRDSAAIDAAPRSNIAPRAVPERPGEPSLIEHVVYIIKENRTYDQVLGDIGKGESDPRLAMYGREVTPNTHALAEQYVLLDHFFASGGNSADGHQWLTQANETEYPLWPLYPGRSYPSEGNDALAYSSGGFLWESAQQKGKTVVNFGEYAIALSDSKPEVRARLLQQYRDAVPHNPATFRNVLKGMYNTRSPIPSLDKILVREYPPWTQEVPDVVKADAFLDHLREWTEKKAMPNLVMMILPSDHTVGTNAGWCTPKACVADNDLALGKIVEGLSHSPFWKKMAVMVVEDDAQNGVDHIDGHRTVALVVSPFVKRGAIDSTFYSQPSMVKTIELMLGLPALSLFDLVATDMRASFIGPGEQPNDTPYTAIEPKQSIYELNQPLAAIAGPFANERKKAARDSARMVFTEPDAAPTDKLNQILWYDAMGWGTKFPGVKQSLFFPMSIDISDEDREEKREEKRKR